MDLYNICIERFKRYIAENYPSIKSLNELKERNKKSCDDYNSIRNNVYFSLIKEYDIPHETQSERNEYYQNLCNDSLLIVAEAIKHYADRIYYDSAAQVLIDVPTPEKIFTVCIRYLCKIAIEDYRIDRIVNETIDSFGKTKQVHVNLPINAYKDITLEIPETWTENDIIEKLEKGDYIRFAIKECINPETVSYDFDNIIIENNN